MLTWGLIKISLDLQWVISLLRQGPELRKARGVLHHGMNQTAILSYRDIQSEEVKRHLLRLLKSPENFSESGKKYELHSSCFVFSRA